MSKKLISTGTDAERRVRQGQRLMRFVRVHRMSRRLGHVSTAEKARRISHVLGVCERTIYRDMQILRTLYDNLKTDRFD